MKLYENNYFQSIEFKSLNEQIFNSKIIEINNKNYFILRNNFKTQKIRLSKVDLGTEFRGILEFFGQPIDIDSKNYIQKLNEFLKITHNIIKINNPGIIIFRSLDIQDNNKYQSIKEIFESFGYICRSWNTNIIQLNDNTKEQMNYKYNIKREIRIIKELNPKIEKINNFNQYTHFLDLFFNTDGHSNYPNRFKYYKKETWENLKKNHIFFFLKMNNEVYATFGIRIFKYRAYWCMVGRTKKFKHSLHAYAIDFLVDFLKSRNIQYLDLAGYNPNPKNKKEKGIKFFKEKFRGNVINQPTFILDNTSIIKKVRHIFNQFKKDETFPDESLI